MAEAEPAKTAPTAARPIAKSILLITGLLAIAMAGCAFYQHVPPDWPIGNCRKICPQLDDSKARVIAFIILVVLVATEMLVHRLDKLGVNGGPAAGIVGRYRQLSSLAAAEKSAAPTPLENVTQTAEQMAAVVARGIVLANENEKNAAREKQERARFHETDKSAVRAFMSKQSVFAALSLFLLKAVSTKLPPGFPCTFQECLYVLSAGGFLVTLLTVLAAIQTYSTYVRIQWDDASGIELLKKGRRFDEVSFYALTISLLVALCAYQPWAALVTLPLFGTLMYKYYFFKP
jgi:hypothetical protein